MRGRGDGQPVRRFETGQCRSAAAGHELRIVDTDSGAELPTGEHGLLEARITAIDDDWIRTTDIASIDEDGFITLHGGPTVPSPRRLQDLRKRFAAC